MNKLALIILDGWGIGKPNPKINAIHAAHTPFYDELIANWPHTALQASHEYVGLPHGQMGGSEVGHLTIGAGRVYFTDLPKISRALNEPTNTEYGIMQNHTFIEFINIAKQKTIHLIGMVSPGGIHSHMEHLFKLIEIMQKAGCKSPIIHFISDGRDTPPQAGHEYAQKLLDLCKTLNFGHVVNVTGRFYAMDRDNNADRVQKAVDVMTKNIGVKTAPDLITAFTNNYKEGLTDELQQATSIDINFKGIAQGDPMFFFNFRSDRMKQIVTAINNIYPNNPTFTMTQFDKSYKFPVFFEKQILTHTLGQIISEAGIKQLRVAETDKVPHVTYFFNGGTEVIFNGEIRKFVDSVKVTYDKAPQMKAAEIVQTVKQTINQQPDIGFCVINIANADLVGHFGVFESTVKACECVDIELKNLTDFLTAQGFICVVTADHGNADYKIDEVTGKPLTSHSLNPVPFIIYSPQKPELKNIKLNQAESNGLSCIAGTLLDLIGIKRPNHDYQTLIES